MQEAFDSLSDEQLLQQWGAGDALAGHQLYERHFERTFLIAWGFAKNATDAQDISQEVWKIVIEHNQQAINNFAGWIKTVTKNKSRDFLKSKWQHSVRPTDFEASPELQLYYHPEQQILDQDLLEKCLKHFDLLPPLQAQCYYLRIIENLSYKEIALLLNISEKAVQGRIQRAKERFRKYRDSDFKVF